jgi:hypothetical protein
MRRGEDKNEGEDDEYEGEKMIMMMMKEKMMNMKGRR